MNNLRGLRQSYGQRVSFDGVLTRIGELARENLDSLAKLLFHDDAPANLLVGGGGRLVKTAALQFKVTGPGLWLHRVSAGNVVQVVLPATTTAITVDTNAAGASPRYDLVEGRWTMASRRAETTDFIVPSTGVIGPTTNYTDNQIELEVKLVKGTVGNPAPAVEAGSAAQIIGTTPLPATVTMTGNYNLKFSVDGVAATTVDFSSAPAYPTVSRANVVAWIASLTTAAASLTVTNQLVLTSPTTGYASTLEFTAPTGYDAFDLLFGLDEHTGYDYLYRGGSDYFKIGEVLLATGSASITAVYSVDAKTSWSTSEAGTGRDTDTLYSMYMIQQLVSDLGFDAVITRQSGGNVPQLTFEYWFGTAAQFAANTASDAGWDIASGWISVPGNIRILLGENLDPTSPGTSGTAEKRLGGHYSYQMQGAWKFSEESKNILIHGVDKDKVGIRLLGSATANVFTATAEANTVTTTTGSKVVTAVSGDLSRVGVGDYMELNAQDEKGTGSKIYEVIRKVAAGQVWVDRNVGTGAVGATWYRPPQHITFDGFIWFLGTPVGTTAFTITKAAGVHFDSPLLDGYGTGGGVQQLVTGTIYTNKDCYFDEIGDDVGGYISGITHGHFRWVHGFSVPKGAVTAIITACHYSQFNLIENMTDLGNIPVLAGSDHVRVGVIRNIEDGRAVDNCDYLHADLIEGVSLTSGDGGGLNDCAYGFVREIRSCSATNGGGAAACSKMKFDLIVNCTATARGGSAYACVNSEFGLLDTCTAAGGGGAHVGGGLDDCDKCIVTRGAVYCGATAAGAGANSAGICNCTYMMLLGIYYANYAYTSDYHSVNLTSGAAQALHDAAAGGGVGIPDKWYGNPLTAVAGTDVAYAATITF